VIVDVHQVVKDLDGTMRSDGRVLHAYIFQNGLVASMEIRQPT
jgi:hypothetical protein